MDEESGKEGVFQDIEALVRSAGCELVEFTLSRHRGSSQVRAVIYAPGGTGIQECAAVHRLMQSRLQVLLGEQEPSVEVASPGTERVFKTEREYGIFKGRGVRLYSRERSDWVAGILAGCDGKSVTVRTRTGEVALNLDDVAKARLDHSQEVG